MMSGQISAEVGQWYNSEMNQSRDTNQSPFEVVTIDYDQQLIEVQYFDGDIDYLNFFEWKTLTPQCIAAPQEWDDDAIHQDPCFSDYAINEALRSLQKQAS